MNEEEYEEIIGILYELLTKIQGASGYWPALTNPEIIALKKATILLGLEVAET